jgi:hypothetical protein
MSDPGPFEMEEGDHVPLTYAGLKRWLGLVLLVILAACLASVLNPILLLFAIVILLAMVLNPIMAAWKGKELNEVWPSWCSNRGSIAAACSVNFSDRWRPLRGDLCYATTGIYFDQSRAAGDFLFESCS